MTDNNEELKTCLRKEMPIIIFTCANCHIELFRAMTYEIKNYGKNFCFSCAEIIEIESWKYKELCK